MQGGDERTALAVDAVRQHDAEVDALGLQLLDEFDMPGRLVSPARIAGAMQ